MALTHPSWTVDTTFSGKNIASAASVYTFTAAAAGKVQFCVKATVAGNGDYIVYLTHQWLGTGTAAVVLPKTTAAAASGETVIEFVSQEIAVKATDVVDVMIDGLAGDTSVSGAIRISADNPSVFDATSDVPAVNVTYSAGVAVSSRLAEAADLPAAAPTADVVADAVWDEMIADHAVAGSTGEALDGATAPTAAAIWSYVSRTLTATPAQTTDGTTASAITRKRGNSWSISLTLGALTGYTSLWFTVKRSYDDADSAALVQIKLNASGLSDGLLTVNGAAATNDALGSITVSDATTGAIVIALDETVTDDIAPGVYYYDAQALISGDVSTPDSGTLTVTADVTRSVA